MRFAVKDTLTEEEIQSGLRAVIKDGLTTQMMVTLTGGMFLVSFALKLGACNSHTHLYGHFDSGSDPGFEKHRA